MTAAFLVLDMQRDFLGEDARMPVARDQVEGILSATNAVVGSGALEPVYVGNEFPRSQWLLNFFRRGASVVGSPGAALDPRLRVVGKSYFPKATGDAFGNPALDAHLRERGVEQLVVAGVFANHCVRATVRGAIRLGYRVTVLRDGVAAGSARKRDAALRCMEKDGAQLTTSGELLRELEQGARR